MSKNTAAPSKAPEKKETLEDIYRKDAETDRKDAAYEAQLMDILQRKDEKHLTMREKMEGTKAFAKMLAEPKNHGTARVFLLTSFALFTLPFIVFFISVFFVEPMVGSSDPDTFNALSAIITTLSVVITYVVYAFKTDVLNDDYRDQQKGLDYPHLSGLQPTKKKDTGKKSKKD